MLYLASLSSLQSGNIFEPRSLDNSIFNRLLESSQQSVRSKCLDVASTRPVSYIVHCSLSHLYQSMLSDKDESQDFQDYYESDCARITNFQEAFYQFISRASAENYKSEVPPED